MGAFADSLRKRHHERVSIEEKLVDLGPIPAEFLFSEDFRKSHKKSTDGLTYLMNRACSGVVPDMQILLVALMEATGNNIKVADGYIELAAHRVQESGFCATVDTTSHGGVPDEPKQLNVLHAIKEAEEEKAARAEDKTDQQTPPTPRRTDRSRRRAAVTEGSTISE